MPQVINNYVAPVPTSSSSTDSTKKDPNEIEVVDIVTQGTQSTVKLMTDEEFYKLKGTYKEKMDGEPEMPARMNKIQATCFQLLIKAMLIYVDFAVWPPFGDRNIPRRKFTGMAWGPSGLLQMVEIYGPSCFRDWEASYMLFRTACISFNVIGAELLDQYLRKIKEAVETYPDAWALIYQFDTRTRNEHAQEVRYMLTQEDDIAKKNGWVRHFNKERPWNCVWKRLVHGEESWWNKQLEKPCHNICMGLAQMSDYIGHDAPIAGSSSGSGTNPGFQRHEAVALRFKRQAPQSIEPPPKRQALALQDAPPLPPPRSDHPPVKSVNGKNRPLCKGFQTGCCRKVNKQSLCAVDNASAHQCELCLKTSHGSSSCPLLVGDDEAGRYRQPAAGRGAGRKGGRGRRQGGKL